MKNLFNSKKKIIIGVIFLCVILIGGSIGGYEYISIQKHKEYESAFTKTTLDVMGQTVICEQMIEVFSTKWSTAIDDGEDFNNAISEVQQGFKDDGTLNKVNNNKAKIEKEMIKLQNPPKDYEKAYNLFVELYSKYGQIYSQATSPTGSLTTYNEDTNSKSSEFNEIYDKLAVLRPEIKSNKK
ncbi:hypothetical protein [Clostridium felsineum]|uniref:hypothetical protein n=1 Tax=Clostridium felsineum TaxID=36839 RepID=UPI00098CBEE5|nr:hypothetical protein [Clostridium felsineum]URZ18770.1 hypothetical protein CLFE_048580 [Clostridium felsineum DSM 794]